MALEIIRSYRTQRATHHQLMRRLVSYDGWFAPLDLARRVTGRADFDQICMYGDSCRQLLDQLWLFTSADEVMFAHERYAARSGYGLVPYAGPMSGIELFSSLSRQLRAVVVDIVGRPNDVWVIDGSAIDVARRWGQALSVERAIAEGREHMFVEMIAYDDYLVFETMDGELARVAGDGTAEYLLAFTAIDAAELALTRYTGALRAVGTRAGRELFASVGECGVALNVAGPTMPMLPFEPALCAYVAELAVALGDDDVRFA